jgi:hypothetical protein
MIARRGDCEMPTMLADEEEAEPVVMPEEGGEEGAAEDADLGMLQQLLRDFFEEERGEPSHAADRRSDDRHSDDRRADDSASEFYHEPEQAAGLGRAKDAVMDVLEDFKPHVARLRDSKLTAAYNRVWRGVNGRSEGRDGYRHFAGAARTRAADVGPEDKGKITEKRNTDLQAAYDAIGSGKSTKEVTK